jgi:hypothetical protein
VGVTGSGANVLAVGSPGADDEGKAFLVNRSTGSTIATLTSPNGQFLGRFGEAVSVIDDVSGDGFPDVVVGAPEEDVGNATNAGRAYIFNGQTGAFVRELQTDSPNLVADRRFGDAVSGIGDINGDDIGDILVGAPLQNSGGSDNAGKAYVFSGSDGSLLGAFSGNNELNGRFGTAVAGVGDVVGSAVDDFVIGAPRETATAAGSPVSEAGRVYVIDGDSFSQTVVTSSNPDSGGQFGRSVAAFATSQGPRLAVGAFNEDPGGQEGAGRAYIFDASDFSSPPRTLISESPEPSGEFGRSVAAIEDIDGDNRPDVLIGAPNETVNGTADAGRAYVFSSATGALLATLSSPSTQDGEFGTAVAGSSQPIVGAPREDGAELQSGRVYTFTPGINLDDGRDGAPYTAPAPSPGTDANPVGRFRISAGAVGPSLTEVIINNNAPDPSGIDAVELWRSDDATFDASTDTEIASTSYASSITFSGLDASLSFNDPSDPDAGTYFFVVADLAATVAGDYDPFVLDETNVSFDGGVLFSVNGTETSTFTDAFLSDASTPLPVELASFDADVTDDRTVQLQWQTTSETGNSGFRVQRSDGGSSWTTLGRVEGAGTTDEPQSYRFADANTPYAADSLQYRLAQVDVDGTVNFSDPVTVRFGNPNGLELLGSFPNPARSQATVRFAIPEQMSADNVRLELYDLLGRQVKTIPAAETSGRVEQTLDVSDLPSGTYLLRLSAGGQTQTQQVTIVR